MFSAAAAKAAVDHGVTRLEINRAGSYAAGGLTPTPDEVTAVVSVLGPASPVPLRVMIRPLGPPAPAPAPADGSAPPDFLYTDAEVAQMRGAIAAFAASGVLDAVRGDGFVFGVLERGEGEALQVDSERSRALVQAAAPYVCVFHRAFDAVLDGGGGANNETCGAALASLRECGFAGVLTAGGTGARGAVDHSGTLVRLAAATRRLGFEVIVGGGVRSGNVETLAGALREPVVASSRLPRPPLVAFHSSCLADAAAAAANGAASETVSEEEVGRIRRILDSLDTW